MNKKGLSRRDFLKGAAAGAVSVASIGVLSAYGAETSSSTDSNSDSNSNSENTESASADWLGVEPEIKESEITDTWETDILIVGAGNGGMMAAAKAADMGLNFRIIESMSSVGRTRHWCGAVNTEEHDAAGISIDTKMLLQEISRYASGKCDQRVVKTWIDESAEMHHFSKSIVSQYDMNIILSYGEEGEWPEDESGTVYMFPFTEHYYSAGENAEITTRNEIFQDYVQKQGYEIDFDMTLVKLEKKAGKVTGVIAQNTDEEYIRINASKGVLLATGGYPGNPEMMEQLDPLGTSVTTCMAYLPQDKGQGIKAAVWAGASMDTEPAPMLFDRGLVAPGVDAGYVTTNSGDKKFPGTITQFNLGTQPFLKVNRKGERFTNESGPYNDMSYAASHQPGHVYAQIFDSNWKEDVGRFHTIGCSAQTRNDPDRMEGLLDGYIEEGLAFKADTLEELAVLLGFEDDAQNTFLDTIARYNELYEIQSDDDFAKPAYRLSSIANGPFYGYWLGASLLTTLQGVSINHKAQAVDKDGEVIEGLYATGDCSGSFFANNYPCLMPGLALGRTMTFAIKAIKVMTDTDE